MTIAEILHKVENVNSAADYWFVRTEHGRFFDQFVSGGYIAIGWDYLTLQDLRRRPPHEIKEQLAVREQIDLTGPGGKIKATTAYNKMQKFISLKKDDVVIIPSRNSDKLAFGKILDEAPYEEVNAHEFIKRRRVAWEEIKDMDDLNPIFYQVKSNQHTISKVNHYAQHIDRVIGTLFKKEENTHYVLRIEKSEDIQFDELEVLMSNIKTLINNINNELRLDENTNDFYVKINLQSKGTLELIKAGKCLGILAYLLFLTSCSNLDSEQNPQLKSVIETNREVLESTSGVIDRLEVNTNELTKPFEDNGN